MTLVQSLHQLMKMYINANGNEDLFHSRIPDGALSPEGMQALMQIIRQNHYYTKHYLQTEFSSLPPLEDFDWRLDVKVSSKTQERIKKPTLYVKLHIKDHQDVLFEMSKEQLKDVLTQFDTINQQLSALTGA